MHKHLSLLMIVGGIVVLGTILFFTDRSFESTSLPVQIPDETERRDFLDEDSDPNEAYVPEEDRDVYIVRDISDKAVVAYRLSGGNIWSLRMYPAAYSDEAIEKDFSAAYDKKFPEYFGLPTPTMRSEEYFLSENLFVYNEPQPDFITGTDECFEYMAGDKCVVHIKSENPYGLPSAILDKNTGPYDWGKMTLRELRVIDSEKVFLVWAFGDAGYVVVVNTVWNVKSNTLIQLSRRAQSMMTMTDFILGASDDKFYNKEEFDAQRSYTTNIKSVASVLTQATEISAVLQNMPLTLQEGCRNQFGVLDSEDRADVTAEWVVYAELVCAEDVLAREFYRWDPLADTVDRLTGMMVL